MTYELAGKISGATLGYITNGIPGAVAGYYFGKKHGQKLTKKNSNMAPLKHGTKRSHSSAFRAGTSTRTHSARALAPPYSRKRKSTRARGAIRNFKTDGSNLVAQASLKKGKKVHKEGRKKVVKVSKKLRKAIKSVMKQTGPIGIVKEVAPVANMFYLTDNTQRWELCTQMVTEGVAGWAFTPTYIAQLYDILWMKGSYGATFATDRTYAGLGNGRPNMKIHVKEQYYIVKIKNVSARNIAICLMDISPKNVQELSYDTLQYITGELSRTSRSGAAGTPGQEANENPLSCVKEILGFSPKLISSFRNNYSMDETFVTLEPGKEYYHKVKGPNDKLYNYNSFFKNGTYRNIQKFVKQTVIRYWPDLVSTSLGLQPGRYTDQSAAQPYGLSVEVEYFTKLKMPDQTGFQTPAAALPAGTVQTLGQRGYAWMIRSWYDAAQSGGIIDIEDENPQAQAINAL